MMGLMMLFGLLVFVGVVVLIALAVSFLIQRGRLAVVKDPAVEILRERYARGGSRARSSRRGVAT